MIERLIKDPYFRAAVIAALLFWAALYFVEPGVRSGPSNGIYPGLLLLGVVYPVLEELAFRGLLQGKLSQYEMGSRTVVGISYANLATSLLFVFCHLWGHTVLWALATFFPSIVFGYFKDKYQSVTPTIVIHVYFNVGYFLTTASY